MQTAVKGFRLSPQQSRIYSLQQHSHTDRVEVVVQLKGPIVTKRLRESLHQVVANHEILRTHFRTLPSMQMPIQVIEAKPLFAYQYCELEKLAAPDHDQQLANLLATERERPFDLAEGPLLRVQLIRVAPQEHVLQLILPTLCADHTTLMLLLNEICTYYSTESEQLADEEPLQYVNISSWQQDQLEEEDAAPHLDFWQKIDLNAANQTPTPFAVRGQTGARSGAPVRHDRDARARLQLPTDLTAQVNHLIEQWQVSEELFWLTCWSLLITRLTNTPTHHIGLLANGRSYEELQTALGPYSRVLPLPIEIQVHETIQQTLQHLLPSYQRALEEQDYWVWPSATASQEDLTLPLSFAFLDWSQSLQCGDATVTLYELANSYEPATLHLEVVHTPHGHQLTISTDPTRISASASTHLSQCLLTLLQQFVRQPELPISAYHLVSSDEQQRLLSLLQGPELALSAATLSQRFEDQVRLHPDDPALRSEDVILSYTQVNCRANQLARWLREQGVGANVLVALCLPRGIEMIVGLLAILKAGGAYVPMDPEHPIERLAYQIEQTQTPLLLISEHDRERLSPLHECAICIEDLLTQVDNYDETDLAPLQGLEDLLYVIYTSGSTGKPKGVLVHQRNAINYISALLPRLAPQAGLQIATVSTLAADLGNTAIFCALLSGGCLHVLDYNTVTSGAAFAAYTRRHPLDMLKIVPSHLQALLSTQEDATILPRRTLVLGGEALPIKLLARLHELGATCQVWNHYGPTETTIGSLVAPLGVLDQPAIQYWQAQGAVPIGQPIANTHLYVLDPHGHLVPPGIAGELYIGGAGVTAGYLHQPEQSERRFVSDPFRPSAYEKLYRTGDLVRMNEQGQLIFSGRIDQQIKIRGHRIELGEIEAVLSSYPNVWRCVVIGHQDEEETRLVGYIVARQQPAPTAQELRTYLQQFVPAVMIPSTFMVLPKLPLNANGKIDRAQLPAPVDEQPTHATSSNQIGARTPIEELLLAIWRDILHVPSLSIHDNFFSLGGHSLLATQVIARLRNTLEVELPILTLFEAPTIAQLAQHVEGARRTGTPAALPPPLLPADPEQSLPLSFAQQRLWFLDQLHPGSTAYNKVLAVTLEGLVHDTALETALKRVVERHTILRTTFALEKGMPVQRIQPLSIFSVQSIDISATDDEEANMQVHQIIQQEAAHSFNLAHDALFRATLLHINSQKYVLVLCMHHIVSDGWSNAILLRELTDLYQATAQGKPSPLAALPIQYADYALWQRTWLQGERLDAQLNYWTDQLAGVSPLQLPTIGPRPTVQSTSGARAFFTIPADIVATVRQLSQRSGTTLFMTMLAAFQVLLARISEQDDIVVGTDIANRTQVETEPLIGFFVNLLALRARLGGHPSFHALLQQVRQTILEAYLHQDTPFDMLIDLLRLGNTLDRVPLIQVLFVLQNTPNYRVVLPEVTISALEGEAVFSKFDLAVFLSEADDGTIRGSVNYSTDLFAPAHVALWMHQYETLLRHLCAEPDMPVDTVSLLTQEERDAQELERQSQRQGVRQSLRITRGARMNLGEVAREGNG